MKQTDYPATLGLNSTIYLCKQESNVHVKIMHFTWPSQGDGCNQNNLRANSIEIVSNKAIWQQRIYVADPNLFGIRHSGYKLNKICNKFLVRRAFNNSQLET